VGARGADDSGRKKYKGVAMRVFLIAALMACSTPKEPTAADLLADWTSKTTAAIKAVPGVAEVQEVHGELQIIAQPDTCMDVRNVVARSTVKVPKGQALRCGVVGQPARWILREQQGEFVEADK
jgi:hypothetical protein